MDNLFLQSYNLPMQTPPLIEEQGGMAVVPLNPGRPTTTTQVSLHNAEFIALQNMIKAKQDMLLEKQQQLTQIEDQNQFLGQVKKDYIKYNSYIVGDKIRQMEAMKMLTEYLETLTAQGTLSAENMKDALHEQERIKNELETIRANLDDIVDIIPGDTDTDTDSINSDDLYDVPA